ncbi:hypothetical protein BC940DRAFT_365990 [Gongronella butleri]|nr:hypothetical protein BC940DRAFT_365990 [Gongronella butleri]
MDEELRDAPMILRCCVPTPHRSPSTTETRVQGAPSSNTSMLAMMETIQSQKEMIISLTELVQKLTDRTVAAQSQRVVEPKKPKEKAIVPAPSPANPDPPQKDASWAVVTVNNENNELNQPGTPIFTVASRRRPASKKNKKPSSSSARIASTKLAFSPPHLKPRRNSHSSTSPPAAIVSRSRLHVRSSVRLESKRTESSTSSFPRGMFLADPALTALSHEEQVSHAKEIFRKRLLRTTSARWHARSSRKVG